MVNSVKTIVSQPQTQTGGQVIRLQRYLESLPISLVPHVGVASPQGRLFQERTSA